MLGRPFLATFSPQKVLSLWLKMYPTCCLTSATFRFSFLLTLCPTAGKRRPHHGGGCTISQASTNVAGIYLLPQPCIVPSTYVWSFVCVSGGSTEGGAPWRHSTFIETAPETVHVGGPMEESEPEEEAWPRNIYWSGRCLYDSVGGIILRDPTRSCGGVGGWESGSGTHDRVLVKQPGDRETVWLSRLWTVWSNRVLLWNCTK